MPERERPGYQRNLNYGLWAKALRYYDAELPKGSTGALGELVEAFGLAEKRVKDLNSERSHLSNIMITYDDILDKLHPVIAKRASFKFLDNFLVALQEAYEVTEFGDRREEKIRLNEAEEYARQYVQIREEDKPQGK